MKINVTDQDGQKHVLEALEGWRVMEIIRDYGLPIKAECGGACCCATCHVYIAQNWIDKLYPPNSDELDMLDQALDTESNSRLSCQIIMDETLDGLELTLAESARP